jgi:hypothetical protein
MNLLQKVTLLNTGETDREAGKRGFEGVSQGEDEN